MPARGPTRNQSFLIGNAIGIAVLTIGIVVTAPQKMKEQEELEAKSQQEVVVASRLIKEGERLSQDNVKAQKIPREKVPLNAVESLKKALLMAARKEISEGSTISYADVVPADDESR